MSIVEGKQIIDGLEFCTALVASTAHITKEDAELLKKLDEHGHPKEIWAFAGAYGWFVYVDEAVLEGGAAENGFSEAFKKLLIFTREHGCWFVRLDCDGPEIEGLEKFDW